MRRRQARRVGEALGGVDILALVDRRQMAQVPVEDRDQEVGLHPGRHLAPPVGRDRLHQQAQQVRAASAHLVEDGRRADQGRQPARARRPQAEQGHHVARIGVVGLALAGLVDADVGVVALQAEVADVAQHMPLGILRAGAAEMGPQAEEGGRRLAHRPALDRQATQQGEAAAVQHRAPDRRQARAEARQREVLAADRGDVALRGGEAPGGRVDLGHLARVQYRQPGGVAGHLRPVPDGGALLERGQFGHGIGSFMLVDPPRQGETAPESFARMDERVGCVTGAG
jgi:hypothetical protein